MEVGGEEFIGPPPSQPSPIDRGKEILGFPFFYGYKRFTAIHVFLKG